MKTIEVNMEYSKSTKNTHVYKDSSENTAIPTIYIKHHALHSNIEFPKNIKVVISHE